MHSGAVLSPDGAPQVHHRARGVRSQQHHQALAGTICQLQKQVSDLQAQLAKAQAELVNMQLQQANLLVNHGNGTGRIRPISNIGSHRLLHRQRRHYYDHRRQLLLRRLQSGLRLGTSLDMINGFISDGGGSCRPIRFAIGLCGRWVGLNAGRPSR
ncbi:uncharacterized protein LOC131150872 isoform X2 [Malania oleifera]|uniref:uncharacterized protein LOC131150872 isoform X2 n=1 Tax=Malania oleifera TaxID=397392 RepID=UPI0025AEB911|nr:uncharacterized protein LOC131150872 isoform X2 [Malania oleifera]